MWNNQGGALGPLPFPLLKRRFQAHRRVSMGQHFGAFWPTIGPKLAAERIAEPQSEAPTWAGGTAGSRLQPAKVGAVAVPVNVVRDGWDWVVVAAAFASFVALLAALRSLKRAVEASRAAEATVRLAHVNRQASALRDVCETIHAAGIATTRGTPADLLDVALSSLDKEVSEVRALRDVYADRRPTGRGI